MTPPADLMGECAPGKEALDALDRLDILFNNIYAGIGAPHAAMSKTKKTAHESLATVRRSLSALREEAEQLREERDAPTKSGLVTRLMQRAAAAEAELARYREGMREIERDVNDGKALGHIGYRIRALLAADSASEAATAKGDET